MSEKPKEEEKKPQAPPEEQDKFYSKKEFERMIDEKIATGLEEINKAATKVDRKWMAGPGMTDKQVEGMTLYEKAAKFLKATLILDAEVMKELSVGTVGAGGYVVFPEYKDEIILQSHKASVIRPNAHVITTKSGSGYFPSEGTGVDVNIIAENTDITETAGTAMFGQMAYATTMLAARINASEKLVMSEDVGLAQHLAYLFGVGIAAKEDYYFAVGTGSSQPKGITAETFTYTVAQKDADLAYLDLNACLYGLPSQDRKNAKWLMHNDLMKAISLMQDSTNRPLWRPSMREGEPELLLGKPILEQNDIGTATILLGNFQKFYIFDHGGISIKTTDVGGNAFDYVQVKFRVTKYVDSECANEKAFSELTGVSPA